jgi:hypothetical protein
VGIYGIKRWFFRFFLTFPAVRSVRGYGSPHEKGVDGGERLARQRDRNEVTNSRPGSKNSNSKVFDIISELRPKCSTTKMKKTKMKKKKR